VTTWEISFAQSENAEQSSLVNRKQRLEFAPGVMQIGRAVYITNTGWNSASLEV